MSSRIGSLDACAPPCPLLLCIFRLVGVLALPGAESGTLYDTGICSGGSIERDVAVISSTCSSRLLVRDARDWLAAPLDN